jgi:hypothetical protein
MLNESQPFPQINVKLHGTALFYKLMRVGQRTRNTMYVVGLIFFAVSSTFVLGPVALTSRILQDT